MFRVLLQCRLRLPLPLSQRFCGCGPSPRSLLSDRVFWEEGVSLWRVLLQGCAEKQAGPHAGDKKALGGFGGRSAPLQRWATANPEVQQTAMEWHSQKLDGSRNEPTLNSLDLAPGHNSWSLPLRWVASGLRKQRSSFACLPEHVPGRNRDSCSVVWSKLGDHGGTPSSGALLHGRLRHLCSGWFGRASATIP